MPKCFIVKFRRLDHEHISKISVEEPHVSLLTVELEVKFEYGSVHKLEFLGVKLILEKTRKSDLLIIFRDFVKPGHYCLRNGVSLLLVKLNVVFCKLLVRFT